MKISKAILTLVFGFFIFSTSRGQEESKDVVGLLLASEMEEYSVNPALGFFWERKFTDRSGMETGIFYRTTTENLFLTVPIPDLDSYSESTTVRYGFFAVPVLYRFSTRFVVLSLGPNVDVFSNWNQLNAGLITIESLQRSPMVNLGMLFKVGTEIPLKGTLILEPEIRLGLRSVSSYSSFLGVGVKLKQQVNFRN